ncbi:hypothetical protein VIBNISFn118_320010 [Vibrio nigripulchritudo SFn118]|nr:hypothetical protein VIBNISFn118_320010 [Vibrio nigripulchritudo SFn118]
MPLKPTKRTLNTFDLSEVTVSELHSRTHPIPNLLVNIFLVRYCAYPPGFGV